MIPGAIELAVAILIVGVSVALTLSALVTIVGMALIAHLKRIE